MEKLGQFENDRYIMTLLENADSNEYFINTIDKRDPKSKGELRKATNKDMESTLFTYVAAIGIALGLSNKKLAMIATRLYLKDRLES